MFDYSELKYNENEQLWVAIDKVNKALLVSKQYIINDILEETFKEAIESSPGTEISDEFEWLRIGAFETDYYSVIDKYAQRCSPAIMVAIMCESNNIGINVDIFLFSGRDTHFQKLNCIIPINFHVNYYLKGRTFIQWYC